MRFTKNTKLISTVLIALMLIITVSISALALFFSGDSLLTDSSEISSSEQSEESSDNNENVENDKNDEPATDDTNVENNDSDNTIPDAVPEEPTTDDSSQSTGDTEVEPNNNFDGVTTVNVPDEMRAVFLTAGVDYFKGAMDEATVKAEIDTALTLASDLTMNTIILNTTYHDKAVYLNSLFPNVMSEFDVLEYAIEKAREMGFFTYAVYNVNYVQQGDSLISKQNIDTTDMDLIFQNLELFTRTYFVDGIILDDYYNVSGDNSYTHYLNYGGGMGYENYMLQTSEALFKNCTDIIKNISPAIQVGMMTESVWENQSVNPNGSLTAASFTTLGTGNSDNLSYIEQNIPDFVMIETSSHTESMQMNFSEIVEWWDSTCTASTMPMYVVHASSKAASEEEGWTEYDELIKQVMTVEELSSFEGSAYDSLARMGENPKEFATMLVQYYNDEINPDHVLKELAITQPAQLKFETFEPTITFTGASDPNVTVTFNDEVVQTDANGYFSVHMELVPGDNTFVIEHKGKVLTYDIYRRVVIVNEYSPTGSLALDGGMEITVSALAYSDAVVTATLNGTTITLDLVETLDDATDLDSNYSLFEGEFVLPASGSTAQNLGNIIISGTWEGLNETKTGAAVTVNKRMTVEGGSPVVVVKDQAETFSTAVLNNISSPYYYPLPIGTLDYTVGNEMIYRSGTETHSFYNLASGLRVYTEDIAPTSEANAALENKITGVEARDTSKYTYITVETEQKVSYNVSYNGKEFSVKFNYTSSVPNATDVSDTPIFSDMYWDGKTMVLDLVKDNSFMGYKAYYSGDDLVFRFLNPPKVSNGSLKGVSIFIDPGHDMSDPGAMGYLAAYPERVINYQIAQKLDDELKSRGATVYTLNNLAGGKIDLESRINLASDIEPHILLSVHSNSVLHNTSATGSESFYFNLFSQYLAGYVSQEVAGAMDTDNRGGKYSYLYMTRCYEFASTLVEVGFMSNETEFYKLITESYQDDVAEAIADGVYSYLRYLDGSGTVSSSENNSSSSGSSGSSSGSSGSSSSDSSEIDDVTLDENELTLQIGDEERLRATVFPITVDNDDVYWESDNEAVATVSGSGTVTAHKAGTAIITAYSDENDKYFDECKVTVTNKYNDRDVAVEGIEFDKSTVTVYVGQDFELATEITPANAENTEILWYISNDSLLDVDKDDVFTALKAGETRVIAETEDGAFHDECTVIIETGGDDDVSKVSFTETQVSMLPDDEYQLLYEVLPHSAANKDVSFESDDEDVAEVNFRGEVLAIAPGTATITVITDDGDKTDTFEVTVIDVGDGENLPDEIVIELEELYLYEGDTDSVKVSIYPEEIGFKDLDMKITAVEGGRAVSASFEDGYLDIEANSEGEVIIEIFHVDYDFVKAQLKVVVE